MDNNSIAKKILTSSFWEYLGSWVNKLIGFAATLILARILLPDDFGIVAAASIVTGFFHVMATVGTEQYLLRRPDINYSEYDTGWTINIIMKSVSAVGIFILAAPISNFMGDDRLILVLQVSCLSPFLYGFTNIGLVLYEKDFKYRPKFILLLASRVIGFTVKISFAFYYQSYWAFIIAEIVEAIINVVGSFIIHKFRPKISLTGWKEQWAFSQWILLKSFFVFMRFRVDNIFISKYLPIESLGVYSVSKDVATLPAGQVIEPIMQPLYVGLASINDDKELFADKVHKALSMLFLVVFPIAFGTYITADNLIYILLGAQWGHAVPIVEILAFMLIPGALSAFFTKIMTAMGKVKLIFKFEVLLSLIALGTFALLAKTLSLNEFALLRVSIIFFNTFIILLALSKLTLLSFFRILSFLIIPFVASISMVLVIININYHLALLNNYYTFMVQVFIGGCIYFLIVSAFVFLLRNYIKEYQFIWKTFYLSVLQGKGE